MRTVLSATFVLALTAGFASAGTFTDLDTPTAQLTGLSRNGRVVSCDFWVGDHRDLRRTRPLSTLADIAVQLLGEPLTVPAPSSHG